MENIHYGVAWYQKKIGSYDKQLWEQSVEQKVLKGLQQAPRRSVSLKLKSELIDVDLVRGSTFSKAKPQVSWTYITHKAVTRVILFPFFYKWWLQQTSFKFWLFLLCLYILQVATTLIFFRNVGGSISQDEFSLTEVVIPGLLMLILGLIHSQTVLSHVSHRTLHRDGKHMSRNGKRRKKNFPGFKKKNASDHLGIHCDEIKTNPSDFQQKFSVRHETLVEDSGVALTSTDYSNGKETHSEKEGKNKLSVKKVSKDSLLSKSTEKISNSMLNLSEDKVIPSDSKTVSWSDEYTTSGSLKHGHESQDSEEPREDDSHEEMEVSEDETNGKFEILSVDKESLEALNKKQVNPGVCEIFDVGLSLPEKTDGTILFSENNKIHLIDNLVVNSLSDHRENQGCENVYNSSKPQDFVRYLPCSAQENEENTFENKKTIMNDEELNEFQSDIMGTAKKFKSSESEENSEVQQNIDSDILDTAFKNFSDSDLLIKSNLHVLENKENIYCDSFGFNALTNGQNDAVNSMNFEKDIGQSFKGNLPTRSRSLSGQFRTQGIKRVVKNRKVKTETGSETENDNMNLRSLKGLRRRKIPGDESSESGYNYFRSRRTPPASLKLNYTKESTGISSSEGENSPITNPDGSKGTVSSEEWEDRVQSDVTTSTYSSSSSGSGAELSENDTLEGEEEDDHNHSRQSSVISVDRMTASNLHVINLLQPQPSSQHHVQPPDKVSCMIWERNECKKVDLTAMDIGWSIIEKVDNIPESSDYIMIGLAFSLLLGFVPLIFLTYHAKELPDFMSLDGIIKFSHLLFNKPWRNNLIILNGMVQRLCLSGIFFFLLSVADRTFKQRLLYAKHFCYLTSSRRAKKFDMPHFRLNKVRNIKTWLSLRSYLKKRGPQRSVDVIVSASFLVTIILLTLMCLQLLKDADTFLDFLCNWELCVWCMALGIYLMRFMTLGLKINKKYRNLSVLITEQINLYLQMEQKPHKKEELMVANNVLKLAEDLLKELESPFKISGVSANPVIYNVTKVVVLSAFSAVLTELLGFKLKLYKIKLKA